MASVSLETRSTTRLGVHGLGWSGLAQIVGMVVRLGSTLLLTRALAPGVYGLFGTALALVTTLEWLSDMGVVPALMRHRDGGTRAFLLTGWWINFGRGVALSLTAAMLSMPMARVYAYPELGAVLLGLALRPALLALRSPAMPLVKRRLDYRSVFLDETASLIVGTTVSLMIAIATGSIWSIVIGTLAGTVSGVITSYLIAPMRPVWLWDRRAAEEIGGVGRSVFVNTLVMALWLNLDRLLGLRLVSETAMGLYAVAWNLAAVAEGLLTRACDVSFSLLASRDEAGRESLHRRITEKVSLLVVPAMTCSILLAPGLVRILYDRRYEDAGPILAIFMGRLMLRAVGQVQFQHLLVTARVRMATQAYVVAMIAQAISLVPLTRIWGVNGMAGSALVSTGIWAMTQAILERNGRAEAVRAVLMASVCASIGLGISFSWR